MQELTLSCGVIGTVTTAAIAASFCAQHWPLMHSFGIQHCAANLIQSQADTEHLALVCDALKGMHATHACSEQHHSSHGQQSNTQPVATASGVHLESQSTEASGHSRNLSRFQPAAMAITTTLYGMCCCLSTSGALGDTPCSERLEGVHIDPYVTLRVVTAQNAPLEEATGRASGGAAAIERQGLQLLHLFGCSIGRSPNDETKPVPLPTALMQWTKLIESSTSLQEVCVGQLFPECAEAGLLRAIANHTVCMKSRKRPREGSNSGINEQHAVGSSLIESLLHTVCIRGTHEASGRVPSSDQHLCRVLECERLRNLTFSAWCGCQPGDEYSPAIFFLEDSRRHLPRVHGADALEHFSAAALALPGDVAVRFQPLHQPVT